MADLQQTPFEIYADSDAAVASDGPASILPSVESPSPNDRRRTSGFTSYTAISSIPPSIPPGVIPAYTPHKSRVKLAGGAATRSPSNIRQLQMASPPPFATPGSGGLGYRSNGTSRRRYVDEDEESIRGPTGLKGFETPCSARSESVATHQSHHRRAGSKAVSTTESRAGTPSPQKDKLPLVLLHVTVLQPSRPFYSTQLLEKVGAPRYIAENQALMMEKLSETVRQRGLLITHPGEEYDLLEERVLESLELCKPRVLGCGHFYGGEQGDCDDHDGRMSNALTIVREPGYVHAICDASHDQRNSNGSDSGFDSNGDCFDDHEDDDICTDCHHPMRLPNKGVGSGTHRWDLKIYAANGLMRAGAWSAAWKEMERVDVEIDVWMPEDVRRDLERARDSEDEEEARRQQEMEEEIERREKEKEELLEARMRMEEEAQKMHDEARRLRGDAQRMVAEMESLDKARREAEAERLAAETKALNLEADVDDLKDAVASFEARHISAAEDQKTTERMLAEMDSLDRARRDAEAARVAAEVKVLNLEADMEQLKAAVTASYQRQQRSFAAGQIDHLRLKGEMTPPASRSPSQQPPRPVSRARSNRTTPRSSHSSHISHHSPAADDVPLSTLLKNYVYLLSQDRRNIALLVITIMMTYLLFGNRISSRHHHQIPNVIAYSPYSHIAQARPELQSEASQITITQTQTQYVTPEASALSHPYSDAVMEPHSAVQLSQVSPEAVREAPQTVEVLPSSPQSVVDTIVDQSVDPAVPIPESPGSGDLSASNSNSNSDDASKPWTTVSSSGQAMAQADAAGSGLDTGSATVALQIETATPETQSVEVEGRPSESVAEAGTPSTSISTSAPAPAATSSDSTSQSLADFSSGSPTAQPTSASHNIGSASTASPSASASASDANADKAELPKTEWAESAAEGDASPSTSASAGQTGNNDSASVESSMLSGTADLEVQNASMEASTQASSAALAVEATTGDDVRRNAPASPSVQVQDASAPTPTPSPNETQNATIMQKQEL
jgi:hypothetical protein